MNRLDNATRWVALVFTFVLLTSFGIPATNVSALLPTASIPVVNNVITTSSNLLPTLGTVSSGIASGSIVPGGILGNPANIVNPALATNANIVLNNVQSTSDVTSSSNQIILSNFDVGTGNNRLLVVGVSANDNNAVSVTFGDVQLTPVISSFHNNDAELWYLANPSGNANIVVTMAGSTNAIVGAYAFSGVDQTNPIPTSAANFATVSGSPSISLITKYPHDWVLDLPSIYGGVTLGSPICTQQWNINMPDTITGASSSREVSSPAVVTCNWVASGSGELWDDVAIEIKAAGTSLFGINIGVSPTPPTNLAATAVSNSQIDLSWTAPSTNLGDSIVTGYKVERSTDNGSTWDTIVPNTGSSDTTYSDTGLAASTTYTYRVSAINAVGTSSPSDTASASTGTSTAPEPPTGLSAAAVSSSQINLSWTAGNDGGSAITGYKVERSTDNGSTWDTIVPNTGSSDTTYSDTGLAASTTYTYRVSAINAVGTSSPSDTASASTGAASTGITVYAHRIPASYWDPCFAATCSAGTGPGVTMYFVLYDSSGNVVQTGFANEDGYTFSGLNSSATYYVYPDDCVNCHGSPHDVVFQYWGDDHSNTRPRAAMVGADLHAWYSCTNNCIDGP